MTANRLRLGWVVVLALALSPTLLQAQSNACVKHVGLNLRHPYSFKDVDGGFKGLHVDLVREALHRMQCEAQFVDIPWNRALRDLQSGQLDMLPGAADTPERQIYALFSKPTNRARNVLFVRLDSRKKYKLSKMADLIGTDFRLAVRRGAAYSDAYDALLENPQFLSHLTFVATGESGLQMMAAGRVDGRLGDELTGMLTIRYLGLDKLITRSKLVIADDSDLVAFSKVTNSLAFVQKFNAALGSMLADGSYKKVLERYMPCPVSVERLGCR
jgi:polar amino acid transport system substrate-binding protein